MLGIYRHLDDHCHHLRVAVGGLRIRHLVFSFVVLSGQLDQDAGPVVLLADYKCVASTSTHRGSHNALLAALRPEPALCLLSCRYGRGNRSLASLSSFSSLHSSRTPDALVTAETAVVDFYSLAGVADALDIRGKQKDSFAVSGTVHVERSIYPLCPAGMMFWFTRNRLAGSYLRLISASRS